MVPIFKMGCVGSHSRRALHVCMVTAEAKTPRAVEGSEQTWLSLDASL